MYTTECGYLGQKIVNPGKALRISLQTYLCLKFRSTHGNIPAGNLADCCHLGHINSRTYLWASKRINVVYIQGVGDITNCTHQNVLHLGVDLNFGGITVFRFERSCSGFIIHLSNSWTLLRWSCSLLLFTCDCSCAFCIACNQLEFRLWKPRGFRKRQYYSISRLGLLFGAWRGANHPSPASAEVKEAIQ